jgi:hypothetical protein
MTAENRIRAVFAMIIEADLRSGAKGVITSVEWSHSPTADFIERLAQELPPTPFRFVSRETIAYP